MDQNQKNQELEKKVNWNKRHLRITFIIAVISFLMISGHFYLHFTGKLPH